MKRRRDKTMTRRDRLTSRIGLFLMFCALACVPAPAQEPPPSDPSGVHMVPPPWRRRPLLAALAGPVRARRRRGDRVRRYLVGHHQRTLEDSGPRLRTLVTHRLGRPDLLDHLTRQRAPRLGTEFPSYRRDTPVGDRCPRWSVRASSRQEHPGLGNPHDRRRACLRVIWQPGPAGGGLRR